MPLNGLKIQISDTSTMSFYHLFMLKKRESSVVQCKNALSMLCYLKLY